MNHFIIPARLPGLNEYTEANRKGWQAGARLKKDTEAFIRFSIRNARNRGLCWPVQGAAAIVFEWQERNRLRDLDNIFFAKKFVLDSMVAEKVIKGDSQRYVRILADSFQVGETDQVIVKIILLEGKENGNQERKQRGD